ncbi:hypothetical protein B0H21DRAFT_698518 [Amylocystis lapponica]|nr:hypothetical protein B0H21DRAFT_698518 [Amylocystis lapponica]
MPLDSTLSTPNTQSLYSPVQSYYDDPRLAGDAYAYTSRPASSARLSQFFPAARAPSIIRPKSPVLGALPPPAFSFSGVALDPPDLPSPALTDISSTNAPEGLLHPRLGALGAVGMQSNGAISFQDDMDYSRPIGGLVHNRQYSTTTVQTVDSHETHTRTLQESSERSPSQRYAGLGSDV